MQQFSPLVALTRAHHRPVDPVAFDCVKLIVVRAGSAVLVSDFGIQHVTAGDVVLLAAQTLCSAEPKGSITTTTIYLDRDYVIDQVFWQYAEQFCDRHNARDFFEAHYSTPAQVIRVGEDRLGMLMPWLDELAELSVDGPRPERFLRAQALLFAVLDLIMLPTATTEGSAGTRRGRTVISAAPRHRQFKPLRVEAQRVAHLIRDDPGHLWSVRELAEAVHLSPSQFRRVFVEAFGKTPIAYLTLARIERMAYLLRATDLPIKRIARQVGWADADFAARQFRKSLGVSPRTYRQTLLASNPDDPE